MRRGFTLVEMLVVILIIMLVVSLFAYTFQYVIGIARREETAARMLGLDCKVSDEWNKTKSYPAALIDLAPAIDEPRWIEGGQFVDAYGRAILYAREARGFRVWSLGPDGVDGTPDDIEYDRR